MIDFIKENIWLVIFVILAVIVNVIVILDEKKNISVRIKSKVLRIIIILVILSFLVLLVLFDFDVI